MITLKTLSWSDAFSYGKNNKIDFTQNKLTQIVGKNGHGKSSISLILEEVLYNKNTKGVKKGDILNRYSGAKSYSAGVEFEKDGDLYSINTIRSSTQKVVLIKNGEDISAHTATGTYKIIEEIIGKDLGLIYQSSALSMDFLVATDTKRKQFLVDLLGLNKYTEAFEIFKNLAKEVNTDITSLESKVTTVSAWLENNSNVPSEKIDLVAVPEKDNSLLVQKSTLETELANITRINKDILQNNTYKQSIDAIGVVQVPTKPESTNKYIEAKTEASTNKKNALSIVSKMSSLKGTCPTCLQKIDTDIISKLLNENNLIIEDSDRAIELATKAINSLNAEIDEYNKQSSKVEKLSTYTKLYDSTKPIEPLNSEELKEKISEISDTILALERSISKAIEYNNKASATNAKVDLILEQSSKMKEDLSVVKAELFTLKDRLSQLEILKKAFSTTGLLAYKIECLVKGLEDITNKYLGELSAGRFVILFKVVSDKLNVIISDNGTDIGIESLSSGEKARVNTATLLAIRKLMQSLSNTKINLLILDETIENLDVEGKERLVDILFNEPDLNTFLISHSYTHPLLEKLIVTKENNISRIENG